MTELKPCPFCGGEAEVHPSNEWDTSLTGKTFFVWCDRCETRGDYYGTEAEAAEAWNTRAATTIGQVAVEVVPTERTCKNVGYYVDSTRFECSECGFNGWTKWAADGKDKVPNYCPNCGSRIEVDE